MDNTTLLLIAFMGFVIVGGLGFVLAGGGQGDSKASKRVQALAGGKTERPRARTAADVAGVRRKQIQQTLKAAERQERRARLTIEARLRQAGLKLTVRDFWIMCAVVGALVFLSALILKANLLIAVGFAFAAGFGLPRWVIGFLAKRRMKKFTEEFPNATDVIVRGIKSGLPVHDCLKVIGKESPEPLASEFRKLVEATGMGMSIDHALEKMYERMPTSEVRFFAIVLSIQQKTGGNLAEALGNLSTVLRARKLMVEKIKAMSGEAVASAGIIGALPPAVMGMVFVTTPAYMMPLFTDPRGHLLLLGAGVWMGTGVFVMRRMINFKF
jgi:tight adherence protein B